MKNLNSQKGIVPVIAMIAIVAVIAGIGGGAYYLKQHNGILQKTTVDQQKVKISEDKNVLKKIAFSVMEDYLNPFKSSETNQRHQLKSYLINKIDIDKIEDQCFRFSVNFSVETLDNTRTTWDAGNGEVEGNWVNHKSLFLDIVKNADNYKIRSMGTGGFGESCMGDQITSDSTANWKTYTNTQYGFEVKYPNSWEAEESGASFFDTSFSNPACDTKQAAGVECSIYLSIEQNPTSLSLDAWIKKEYYYFPDDTKSFFVGEDNIEGRESQVTIVHSYAGVLVTFMKDNIVYEFVTAAKIFPTLKEMLSTFKFTK